MAKLTEKIIKELTVELKTYMPERVKAIIGQEYGDEEVSEDQVNKALADFLQHEQDLVDDRTAKGKALSDRTTIARNGRQEEIARRKKGVKPVAFNLVQYNKEISCRKAKSAMGGDVADKLRFAKSKTTTETTEGILSDMYRRRIAATFGENKRGSVEFSGNLEQLRELDAGLAAQVLAEATQTEAEAKSTPKTWFGTAVKYITDGATRAQNAMYRGVIYKIAKWEVQADQVVSALGKDSQWRKDIELVKASEVFKKDMARREARVGSEHETEVREAKNVILELNVLFAKGGESKDQKWFITVVFTAVKNALTKTKEVEQESPKLVVSGPTSVTTPEDLHKHKPRDLSQLPADVKQQGAKAHNMADLGKQAAEARAAKERHGSTTPLAKHKSSTASGSEPKTPPPLPPRSGRGKGNDLV